MRVGVGMRIMEGRSVGGGSLGVQQEGRSWVLGVIRGAAYEVVGGDWGAGGC